MTISILNPLTYPHWDDLLLTAAGATFFHAAAWARVLSESYGYKPLYFTIVESSKLTGLIPVMEIDSVLTGKRGVSMPFTDLCSPLVKDQVAFELLLEEIAAYGRKAGWKGIEFRGGETYFGDAPASAEHFTHTLSLNSDQGKVFAAFKSSTRRNIRKAVDEGLEVSILHTRSAMAEFYRLNCLTRKHHGLPPQPWHFFEKIFEHVIAAKNAFVTLASHKGTPVAAAVYFLFCKEAIYKYGASNKDYQHLRPNNLVMWEAIKWCCQNGIRSVNFGRTEPGNEGLLRFKRAWGTIEGKQEYFKLDLRANRFVAGKSGSKTSYPVFKLLPLPMLRLAGNLLYRHVG